MLIEGVTSEFCNEKVRIMNNIQEYDGGIFKSTEQNQNQTCFCCLVLKRGQYGCGEGGVKLAESISDTW